MRPRRFIRRLASITALLGISSAFSAPAPTAADLARCADLAAPEARLACYDALAGRSTDRAAPSAAAAPSGPTSAPAAPGREAPPGATSAPPAAAAPAAAAPTGAARETGAPPPTFASDPRNFGFSEAQVHAQAQPHAAAEGPVKIEAHVAKLIQGGITGQSLLILDNGQAWMFVDPADGVRLSPGDPVAIKRASLGSFLLLTPSKQSYHVRRTR